MCKFCGSQNQATFGSEICFHFPGMESLEKSVLVFPDVLVCFDCGMAEFSLPQAELKRLRDG
jgi:hypothetical protein